ncbi:transcriptional regulator NanR [Oricola thermophila]|uniref:transcriptional regulator NanR n=1 Tax=Oricola thermophila TaxID=2742145 RepID=UPI0018D8B166|nr:transcriptional regulator NanR [Oricola thermophila]
MPIRRRKLADEVHDRIISYIQANGLKPGDPLPSERELMNLYEVGRPAIREAMQNLQWMGMVRVRQGERPTVAEPSIETLVGQMAQSMQHLLAHSTTTMEHLKGARVAFETAMASAAARNRTEADIAALREALEKQAALKAEPDRFLRQDGEFHRRIAKMSGNPIFESLSAALFNWLAHFHVDFVRMPGNEELTLEEHRSILDAIAAGDSEAAANRMRDHLNRANKLYHQKHLNLQAMSA